MTKEQYCEQIRTILDQASGDKDLSLNDYADICDWVEDDARSRKDAAEADLDAMEEE